MMQRIEFYQYDWDGVKLTNPILIKELIAQERDDHHGGVMTKGQNGEVYFAIGDQNQSGIFENDDRKSLLHNTLCER